jgi:hypothetical protein
VKDDDDTNSNCTNKWNTFLLLQSQLVDPNDVGIITNYDEPIPNKKNEEI